MNLIRAKMNMASAPILFIMDGHVSRLNLSFIKECRKNNIVVLLLPAHTSNCTQPLDNGVNGLFKQTLAKTAARLINSVGEGRKQDAEEKDAPHPPTADNKPFPPVPLIFRGMDNHTFRHVATEQRQLIAKTIPESLEKALEIHSIESAWKKTFLFFSSDSSFDKEKALESFRPGPRLPASNRSHYPNVLEWKINHLEKSRDKRTIDSAKKQEIEEMLKDLQKDLDELTKQLQMQDKSSVQGIVDEIEDMIQKEFPTLGAEEVPSVKDTVASTIQSTPSHDIIDTTEIARDLGLPDLLIKVTDIEEIVKITSAEMARNYLLGINLLYNVGQVDPLPPTEVRPVRRRIPRTKQKDEFPPPRKSSIIKKKRFKPAMASINHQMALLKLDDDYYYFSATDSESIDSDHS